LNNPSVYITVAAVVVLIIWRRVRSMQRPIKGQGLRMLIPLLFLLPGLLMFLNPHIHAAAWEWLAAIIVGVALSVPLIWTTNYEIRQDGQIYPQKNMGFITALISVIAIRFLLREYLAVIDPETQAALFMIVAIGYLIPWRVTSFMKFRTLYTQQKTALSQTE
jgi:membrane protein CcdC involved in cytochrome C biogenesis